MKTLNSSKTSYTTSTKAQQASESTSKMMFRTTYSVAVNWLDTALVMCNHLPEIDSSIFENARFPLWDEDENPIEIFQYFITNCSKFEAEFLEKHFGLQFTYSDILQCFILCVTHYGTSWDYVMIDTDLELAEAEIGTRKIK